MKPTPMTRSMPSAASSRRPASRSEPSPGSMKRMFDAELLVGAVGAGVGAVVERLVAASADVEHDAERVGDVPLSRSAMALRRLAKAVQYVRRAGAR